MAKKDDKMSLLDILKSLFTGGKSGLEKQMKNEPEMAAQIKNVKGMFKDALKDLEDLDKKYADIK